MTVQTVDNVTEFVSAKLKNTAQCLEHMVGKCKYACANPLPSLLTARKQLRIPFLALHPRALMCVCALMKKHALFFSLWQASMLPDLID